MLAPTNNPAPTTNLQTAYDELGSAYDPQVQQLQTNNNTALAQYAQAQQTNLSQLDQAKANAFKNDSLTANARGLFFSGYTPMTNDAYVTNTYNPNVQKVNTTYQNDVSNANTTLQQKIAAINQQRSNDAQTLVSNTVSARQSAAKAAASAASAAPKLSDATLSMTSQLQGVSGKNGYVAPQDYAKAYYNWIAVGLSASTFNSLFGKFKDPTNNYYNYALNTYKG